jgi:hypothetical protein
MGNVLQIKSYRKQKRQSFFRKHGEKLDRSIQNFIHGNMNFDFIAIAERYLNERASNNEMAWDYLELRDNLREAIGETFGKEIARELKKFVWFDASLVSEDEVIDRCLSAFILNDRAKISEG